MSEVILGIDLGTTNSLVGCVDSGFPILLADENNNRITPSAVCYSDDTAPQVGDIALRKRSTSPSAVVTSAKRLIGQTIDSAPEFHLPISKKNNEILIHTSTGLISPVQVSADILSHLKSIAEKRLNQTILKAVITVPAYFNDAQRAATKLAGEMAGLTVERILSEPTAAALAYGLDKLNENSKVIVYDLGGGTFDVSLLELSDGVFQVLATSGDTQLGGDDFDNILARFIWQQHKPGSTIEELDHTLKSRLLEAAKTCKEKLTDKENYQVSLPFISETENLSVNVSTEQFNSLVSPLIEKTLKHCQQVILDTDIKSAEEEIDSVILVGGSSRIPLVRNKVEAFFHQKPNLSQHPDEAVALGAVIQAGILSGALTDLVLLDVTPLSLGIETYGGLMNVIIPRNSTIPCKAGEMFTNAVDSQKSMAVRVLQGEREMAKDNWVLGQIVVPFEPTTKGQARVGVQFSIDENGILEVLTRDTITHTDTVLKIQSAAVDVNDEKVEQMVTESIEHAFDDMSERVFTEAKLKADELLPAIDTALTQVGSLLEKGKLEKIESAKLQVLSSLQSGDANTLKAAVQELDKSTETLATLLVEKAMEDALMKKLED